MDTEKINKFIDEKQQQFNQSAYTDFYSFVEAVRRNKADFPEKIHVDGKYSITELKEIISAMEAIDIMRELL